ncbi:MAG: 5'-nucleotidase [Clostridia bacterium]|nr:5'-nucleotidase [Clostridia bacterium]
MAFDLTQPLVIGISSRALFNLEKENSIFEQKGLEAYSAYQLAHEQDVLSPGAGFPLVRALLQLNDLAQTGKRRHVVEVIIMSRNSADTSLRIFHSIKHHHLDITRAALTGGAPVVPYLRPFHTDLFLSASSQDVQEAVNHGTAAARLLLGTPSCLSAQEPSQIRIAFDGDAVLFGSESERIYKQEGIDAFMSYEQSHANIPLSMGPFANFLMTLSHIQSLFPDQSMSPIRIALVTSRNAPAHERAIRTLRSWKVRVDEAFFLGGAPKTEVLSAFGAQIFFDDQALHALPASGVVPSAVVPYPEGSDPSIPLGTTPSEGDQ